MKFSFDYANRPRIQQCYLWRSLGGFSELASAICRRGGIYRPIATLMLFMEGRCYLRATGGGRPDVYYYCGFSVTVSCLLALLLMVLAQPCPEHFAHTTPPLLFFSCRLYAVMFHRDTLFRLLLPLDCSDWTLMNGS